VKEEILFLLDLLKTRDSEVYNKFTENNKLFSNSSFEFIFPKKVLFKQYRTLDPIVIQLQILLTKMGIPFNLHYDISSYYDSLPNNDQHEINFNFSNTEYIGNLELLMILQLGQFCKRLTNKKVKVTFPNDSGRFISLLKRWNFIKYFSEWGTSDVIKGNFYYSDEDKYSIFLIPIKKIRGYHHVNKFADEFFKTKVNQLLKEHYGMNTNLINYFVSDVISEICQNIPEHSRSTGFIMVHAHPVKANKLPEIEIAISDGGIGIKGSLMEREKAVYESKSHYDTIKEVLNGNFISPDKKEHGGILRARQYVESFNGEIHIRSICAKSSNRGNPIYEDYDKYWRFFPGTQISIWIPRKALQKE